jgi:putative lipoprotein
MKKTPNKKTFWPYGIMLSLVAIFVACVATVVISLDYPVYMDDFYLSKYQNVDKNYNEIQISQAKFEKKYSVSFTQNNVKVDTPTDISIKITPLLGQTLPKFSSDVLLTRKFTTEFDKTFTLNSQGNEIIIPQVTLKDQGIWQIKVIISDDANNTAFYSFDTNATKI